MSAAAPAPRRQGKSPVLTDADLLELFPRDPTAVSVLLVVRLRARGRLEADVLVKSIAAKLGVDRRTVQRALRRIEAAGVPVIHRQGSAGDSISHLFVLDRRRVPALHDGPVLELIEGGAGAAQAPPGGGTSAATHRSSKPSGGVNGSEVAVHTPPEGRAPPRASPRPSEPPPAEPDDRSPTPPAGPELPSEAPLRRRELPPTAFEPELSELRRWLGRRQGSGIEEGTSVAVLLSEGVVWLRSRAEREPGLSATRGELAAARLAVELGVTRPGVDPGQESADKGGGDGHSGASP